MKTIIAALSCFTGLLLAGLALALAALDSGLSGVAGDHSGLMLTALAFLVIGGVCITSKSDKESK